MADVTIKSYRKEREQEITDRLISGLQKAGAIVERQAKINASKSPPLHPQVKTAQLRNSIMHKVDEGDMSVIIGSPIKDPPYPRFLEFGTSRMPPYPWLFPAIEEKRGDIKKALMGKSFEVI